MMEIIDKQHNNSTRFIELCLLKLAHNGAPAAAVRDLLVLIFAYHHHLQVWLMPPSACLPEGRETARIARLTVR